MTWSQLEGFVRFTNTVLKYWGRTSFVQFCFVMFGAQIFGPIIIVSYSRSHVSYRIPEVGIHVNRRIYVSRMLFIYCLCLYCQIFSITMRCVVLEKSNNDGNISLLRASERSERASSYVYTLKTWVWAAGPPAGRPWGRSSEAYISGTGHPVDERSFLLNVTWT